MRREQDHVTMSSTGPRTGTMTAENRALRLIDLYKWRSKINSEIAMLEAAIENEAEAIARARESGEKIKRAKSARCGTESGYYHHRRVTKSDACAACKLAHSMAEKDRAKRKREAAK